MINFVSDKWCVKKSHVIHQNRNSVLNIHLNFIEWNIVQLKECKWHTRNNDEGIIQKEFLIFCFNCAWKQKPAILHIYSLITTCLSNCLWISHAFSLTVFLLFFFKDCETNTCLVYTKYATFQNIYRLLWYMVLQS